MTNDLCAVIQAESLTESDSWMCPECQDKESKKSKDNESKRGNDNNSKKSKDNEPKMKKDNESKKTTNTSNNKKPVRLRFLTN